MSNWGSTALTLAALCGLLVSAEVHEGVAHYRADLPALVKESPSLTAPRSLSAQADPKLQTSALHQPAQPMVLDGSSLSSASYSLHGIKPGQPATCYGQPCSASACYPAALVTVRKFVNYVNVTAYVQFSRRYKVRNSDLLRILIGKCTPVPSPLPVSLQLYCLATNLSCMYCSSCWCTFFTLCM